jgi:uncharacterized protein (DUF1786 family)
LSVDGGTVVGSLDKMSEDHEKSLKEAFHTGFKLVNLVAKASRGQLSFEDVKGDDIVGEHDMKVVAEEQETTPLEAQNRPLQEVDEHEHTEDHRAAASG